MKISGEKIEEMATVFHNNKTLQKERDGCVSFKTVLNAFGGNGIFNDEVLVRERERGSV